MLPRRVILLSEGKCDAARSRRGPENLIQHWAFKGFHRSIFPCKLCFQITDGYVTWIVPEKRLLESLNLIENPLAISCVTLTVADNEIAPIASTLSQSHAVTVIAQVLLARLSCRAKVHFDLRVVTKVISVEQQNRVDHLVYAQVKSDELLRVDGPDVVDTLKVVVMNVGQIVPAHLCFLSRCFDDRVWSYQRGKVTI